MYFKAFKTKVSVKRYAEAWQNVLESLPYKKGAGRIAIHPARTPILLFSGGLLHFATNFSLKQTEPCGP